MDAETLRILQQSPHLDRACMDLVRLAVEAEAGLEHGQTGVILMYRAGVYEMTRKLKDFTQR